MMAYKEEEYQRAYNSLNTLYAKWRDTAKDIKRSLKNECEETQLGHMIDDIKQRECNLMRQFEHVRQLSKILPETVRKVDACAAVTSDLMTILQERLTGIEEFDLSREKQRLRNLNKNKYAQSIFTSESECSFKTHRSDISEKVADAAAEMAAKRAEYECLIEEEEKRMKMVQSEAEMKRVSAQKELRVAQAKYQAYSQIIDHKPSLEIKQEQSFNERSKPVFTSSNDTAIDTLAQAFAKSVALSRLPVPEPFVFSGDPLQYTEWKTSFQTLIDREGVPSEEKIYYLKKYTDGQARKALEGFFFNNDKSVYQSALNVLDERYGHPFVVQRAFRERLEKWPKIAPKDSMGLRDFADFLRSCRDAMSHVPSLKILDDCNENQKLMSKLPDWAALRWNREVTITLESGTYPPFSQFVDFIIKEAKMACNPVTSLFALNAAVKKAPNTNRNVRVLATATKEPENSNNATRICQFCGKDDHLIFKCSGFLALNIGQKRDFVRKTNLCFGCMRKGHMNKDCRKKHTCATCKGRHPTCLHEDRHRDMARETYSLNANAPVFHANSNATATSSCGLSQIKGRGTSMIVPVWVSHKSDQSKEVLTYALLDTQSDTTFILEELATNLQVPQQPIKLNLSTMTSQNTIVDSFRICDLEVRGFQSADRVAINQTYTRNFIPVDRTHIPQRETAQNWPHLKEIVNFIPPLQTCEVGLLIGYNCPLALAPRQILMGEQSNDPYAIKTQLGWSIVGCSDLPIEGINKGISHRIVTKEIPPCTPREVIKVLERDFQNETTQDAKYSQEDLAFLNIVKGGIRTNDSGHLEMPLPFKERPKLPNNKFATMQRLNQLKRKLANGRYHEHYTQYMNGIIQRGEAELVTHEGIEGNVWYIPHHGVYHAQKPDKLRVVYDCSARYKGASLNDHLLTGPDLTNKLVGVLCRFRRYPVAVMCDIEKMFHQFDVRESDRDFLRFLWWEDGNLDSKPLEYRMTKHLFGAASSPGCANYGLKYLAKTHEKDLPYASAFVQNDFYVDDGLASVESEQDAINLIRDAQKLCSSGGLRLHKFISNSKTVIESIPVSERAADIKDLNLSLESLPVERALGIKWCIEDDIFSFQATIKNPIATRRNMLSIVASIFDPIGFLSPFTLTGKKILQQMCKNGVGWDDPLPECVQPGWESWINDIHNLQLIKIPRSLKPADFGKPHITELHHFSDASTNGYGQVSYIRYVNNGKVHCSMLMAKARVAPQKVVTIPRLGLTAATLSVKMSLFLSEELGLKVDKEYFWTDSRVVLGYINNEARRFHVFVANRVQTIRSATDPSQWFYVTSEENPADLASRGLTANGIMNSKWLSGPQFLWDKELKQNEVVKPSLQLGDPEVRAATTLCTKGEEIATETSLLKILTERFSSWYTVVSVVARIQRLADGVKGTQMPSVEERKRAENSILKLVQAETFDDTLVSLKALKTLAKSNNLYPLNPTVKDGLLCVGGRLRKADLSEPFKHPIILPKNGHVTTLILRHMHEKAKHQGRGMTLNFLLLHGYWIIGGNKAVAQYIRNCVVCRKLRRPTETQQMADLPEDRVQPSPPFLYCGMDCFGPFITKQGRKEMKRYGLLFTCMCTRAIHIEMIEDMSTDAFINGLRCFVAIRGAVRQIRSDQGTNFVGARNEFRKAIDIDKMAEFLTTKQCDFVFNAPSSSHTGGVWERQIRTVRSVLDSILLLCPGRLDDSSLRTLFYEVMSIVNCRPLSVSEANSLEEPLTPNHILTAKSEIPWPPPGEFTKEDLCLRKRWRRVQYLLEQFWARWKKEYLTQICLRQKWHTPQRNIKIDDIVLVKDIDLPRNQWPLARVTEVTVDDDSLVRRAKVTLAKGDSMHSSVLERSVHKLVLLLE